MGVTDFYKGTFEELWQIEGEVLELCAERRRLQDQEEVLLNHRKKVLELLTTKHGSNVVMLPRR